MVSSSSSLVNRRNCTIIYLESSDKEKIAVEQWVLERQSRYCLDLFTEGHSPTVIEVKSVKGEVLREIVDFMNTHAGNIILSGEKGKGVVEDLIWDWDEEFFIRNSHQILAITGGAEEMKIATLVEICKWLNLDGFRERSKEEIFLLFQLQPRRASELPFAPPNSPEESVESGESAESELTLACPLTSPSNGPSAGDAEISPLPPQSKPGPSPGRPSPTTPSPARSHVGSSADGGERYPLPTPPPPQPAPSPAPDPAPTSSGFSS